MKFYVQYKDNKPIGLPIRDLKRAIEVSKRETIILDGRDYRVIGIFKDLGEVEQFWNKEKGISETTKGDGYNQLKMNMKVFKETKVWPR